MRHLTTKPATEAHMTHSIGTREQWLAQRLELLRDEKEHTRRADELARRRQALPWVRVEREYAFDGEQGKVSLDDLFGGRSQLLVYHFMFGPNWQQGCPSCSAIADGFDGIAVHLDNHDVALTAVSRAPVERLLAFRRRMGWSFPWVSSSDGRFNFDFNVSFTEEEQKAGTIEYNYARNAHAMDQVVDVHPVVAEIARGVGTDPATFGRDRPGMSAFARKDGAIYHTYSTYARGLDPLWNMYQWLDRAPLGRNESGIWWKRHDEYGAADVRAASVA
jgi:predicted dithiol-disulfide oxidoreductase (DUF899 family)